MNKSLTIDNHDICWLKRIESICIYKEIYTEIEMNLSSKSLATSVYLPKGGARQRRQLGSLGPRQFCKGPGAGLRIPAAGGPAAGCHVDAGSDDWPSRKECGDGSKTMIFHGIL